MRAAFGAAIVATSAFLPAAALRAQSVEELGALSIEELADVEVISASKRAEPISQATTAIFAITSEEIQRSSALTLPELLRLAPNLQIQRLDARQYAITARGFNSYESANKLLVLIDGRTVYTPLHSGVFWELHSPLVEDLEQVEVISGPGGTLFGPNAVNGVINILSKDARSTTGALARASYGENERTLGLRYGVPLGQNGGVRVYGNLLERGDLPRGLGPEFEDGGLSLQGGFRADFGGEASHVTLQGDVFENDSNLSPDDREHGHNLLARYTQSLGQRSELQVQGYYDYFKRNFVLVSDALETFDVEAQLSGALGEHNFVAGGGLRTTRDEFINNLNPFTLDPQNERLWVGNGFVQGEFQLTSKLALTSGVKVERSTLSGWEVLPNLRLAWQADENALLWGAVSRAVRTPSRVDRDLAFLPLLAPADDFLSEKLIAFEAGYRGSPTPNSLLSVNLFFNSYDDLRTLGFNSGGALTLTNSLQGHTYGLEAWSSHQLAPWWRFQLGFAAIGKDFEVKEGEVDLANGDSLGRDPEYRFLARSRMDLPGNLALDVGLRAVGGLEDPDIEDYVEADARLAWRVTPSIELFVAGNNLLHSAHAESNDDQRAQLNERSILAGTRLRFE